MTTKDLAKNTNPGSRSSSFTSLLTEMHQQQLKILVIT